jgi:hypothetical protein
VPMPLTYDHCTLYTSTLYDDFVAFEGLCKSLNEMIKDLAQFVCRENGRKDAPLAVEDLEQKAAISGVDGTQGAKDRSRCSSLERSSPRTPPRARFPPWIMIRIK